MTHVRRQTVLDLHHAIIPVVSRFAFSSELLLRDTIELAPGLHVLSPFDRIIHCAVHAVIEGESGKILKDLYDLFLLLEQHAPLTSQKDRVFARAESLGLAGLTRPPVEAATRIFCNAETPAVSTRIAQWLIDVATETGETPSIRTRIARSALLGYSHWIKMPVGLLIPHLVKKSLKNYRSKAESG